MSKVIQLTDSSGNVFPKQQYEGNTYTPTIQWSGTPTTPMTIANINFYYRYSGEILFVSGRFQITAVGTPTQSLQISLPSGFSYGSMGVVNVGFLIKPDLTILHVRKSTGTNFSVFGSTGGGNITSLDTGYYLFEATLYGAQRS